MPRRDRLGRPSLERVLADRVAVLSRIKPSRLRRAAWLGADDRFLVARSSRGLSSDEPSVARYLRERDDILRGWPGAPRSTVTWGPRSRWRAVLSGPRAAAMRATMWQWAGWLLAPRYAVRAADNGDPPH
jgi:hypothetical protein